MSVARPLMRYFGGKWRLAPWIISHFPAHRVYVEPFCGAASVLMRKQRAYAEILNDLDGEIVSLYRVLRDEEKARELVRAVELTPYSREEFEESYGECDDAVERARRTLFRSFAGFGTNAIHRDTGFRGNVSRSGTIPAHDWATLPAVVTQVIERLQGVIIEHGSAERVMSLYDGPSTLHYIDPPYVFDTRGRNSARYRHEMTDGDHRELAAQIRCLKGMVIVSGYPSALYDELYEGWQQVTRQARADGALERTEVLWISPNAVTRPQFDMEPTP